MLRPRVFVDVLMEAARILMRDGWTQGTAHRVSTGERCAIGAIVQARADLGSGDSEAARERFRLWLELPDSKVLHHPVAIWNDQPQRTAEDVILALKRAASES